MSIETKHISRHLMQVCSAERQRGTNLLYPPHLGFLAKYNYSALALYSILPATLGSGLSLLTICQNMILHLC